MAESMDNKHENIIKEVVQQFIDAQMRGEKPDIDEFVRQHPNLEHQIRESIQDAQRIDTLFDSLVQADASDFEEGVERDLVGKRVGNFEITEMIGRGGMGVVYLANDTKLKRSVAIKSMPAKLAVDSTARMRFRREAELLASLNHPNIAIIHDIIEDEAKTSFLVLEYIEGETLSMRIARESLTIEQALSIGRQIAEAVSAAHKKGIVHRDLKPGNIKITPDGQVKVLDFGLAKPFTADAGNTQATATKRHHIMGTPAYMSPEQARAHPTDHRTDIWSFGCILYQMLTGHLLFQGETATDILAHIIERDPDWKLLPNQISENIRILLRQCLEKDPDKRLADMTDIILQISDTLSRPLTAPVAAISPKLKRAVMISAAIFIVALAAVGAWFAFYKSAQPPSSNIWLAVLPFKNVGPTDVNWFAGGITDEITTRLGYIHGFNVFANQAAIEFKKMGIQNAIDSYGFDYYTEGSVQYDIPLVSNSHVKISIRLINAADSTVVWQETYDRYMRNILTLRSEIAEEVARALDIKLSEPERKEIPYADTDNTEAYACFLQGRQYSHSSKEGNTKAIEMYDKAIYLDPNYARAYASLSNALTEMYWIHDRNREHISRAKVEAEKAIELAPDLPGAHVALGRYYYQGCFDYENALKEFETALRSHPNHAWATAWTAYAKRRQGKFEEGLVDLLRASKLDPVCTNFLDEIAWSYMSMGRYEEAEDYSKKAIRLAPKWLRLYDQLAWIYLAWEGDTIEARKVLDDALQNMKKGARDNGIYFTLVLIDIYEGKYQQALEKLDLKLKDYENIAWRIPEELRRAEIYGYMGRKDLEKQSYQAAVDILEKKIQDYPSDDRYHSSLGKAYAGLGPEYKEDAIKHGNEAVKCAEKDAVQKRIRYEDLARIYVMVGEFDKAIDQLVFLCEEPKRLTIPLLKIDPAWDPLRKESRFQKLIESGK